MNAAQARAMAEALRAVAETIRDGCRLDAMKSIPSGPLYAALMGHVSLANFEAMIGALTRLNLIRVSGVMLTWIGPASGDVFAKGNQS